ncbi:MAG: Methylphosphotriester-DNA--protein-cysteine S-methyltransferase (EC / DNA-3-methyladenine glycosylase II, partial [uncultured Rubrobacteraceae bacterium]
GGPCGCRAGPAPWRSRRARGVSGVSCGSKICGTSAPPSSVAGGFWTSTPTRWPSPKRSPPTPRSRPSSPAGPGYASPAAWMGQSPPCGLCSASRSPSPVPGRSPAGSWTCAARRWRRRWWSRMRGSRTCFRFPRPWSDWRLVRSAFRRSGTGRWWGWRGRWNWERSRLTPARTGTRPIDGYCRSRGSDPGRPHTSPCAPSGTPTPSCRRTSGCARPSPVSGVRTTPGAPRSWRRAGGPGAHTPCSTCGRASKPRPSRRENVERRRSH